MTTESDIIALLAGIDANPHQWRARTLILADACREFGRDAVADALADYAANPHTISAGGVALLRAIYSYRLPPNDRRFVLRLILESA